MFPARPEAMYSRTLKINYFDIYFNDNLKGYHLKHVQSRGRQRTPALLDRLRIVTSRLTMHNKFCHSIAPFPFSELKIRYSGMGIAFF